MPGTTNRITWDGTGQRFWEAGVDRGVLYLKGAQSNEYDQAVAWNGLINASENPEGAEITKLWADNMHYGSLMSAEELKGGIEAYTYPPEFNACEGNAEIVPGVHLGQQKREPFGLCYRSMIGDDTTTEPNAYKLHMIWNATAKPTEKVHNTINNDPDVETYSWDYDTTPVVVPGYKPSASMEIDSRTLTPEKLAALEAILYGSENAAARLPWPSEIITLMKTDATTTSDNAEGNTEAPAGEDNT